MNLHLEEISSPHTHRVDEPLCLHGAAHSVQETLHDVEPGEEENQPVLGASLEHTQNHSANTS